MENRLITVVVPVYNVEKYLDRGIQSIVNQTYPNLEILLIDDGSPDKCPQMCDEWAQKDSRVRVIHKSNEGLGMARNTGIENAHGSFIYFMDSDDYIAPDLIEKAYALATKEKADVVVFGYNRVNINGEVVEHFVPRIEKHVFDGTEVQQEFLPAMLGPSPDTDDKSLVLTKSAWSFFYSKELIDRSNWRFVSERQIISEDTYSHLILGKSINKVAVLFDPLYYYCTNPTSLSRTYREDRYIKNGQFYLKCIELCHQMDYPKEVEFRCTEPYISNVIASLKHAVMGGSSRSETMKWVRNIVADEVLQQVLRQKKAEKSNIARKILFWAMRHQLHAVVYLLVKAQSARS